MALLERQPDGSARVIEDPFARVDDESPIPDSGAVLVSLDRFEAEVVEFDRQRRNGLIGVFEAATLRVGMRRDGRL